MKRETNTDIFHPRRPGRFGPAQIEAAEGRHLLYLLVRDHARAGGTSLPSGLTEGNRRDIVVMAKARSDQSVLRLFPRSPQGVEPVEQAM
jgi:hypothetical protein